MDLEERKIPSTLPVCASSDTPTADSDKLKKKKKKLFKFYIIFSSRFEFFFFFYSFRKIFFTWIWRVLHCNHEHGGGWEINISWNSSIPPGGAHYRRRDERKKEFNLFLLTLQVRWGICCINRLWWIVLTYGHGEEGRAEVFDDVFVKKWGESG